MPRRYDDELEDAPEQDREISLGAASILGIFFLLTLICAACFGFGYAMRGRQTPPAPVATTPATSPAGDGQAKPAAGSVEQPPAAAPQTADTTQPTEAPAAQPAPVEPQPQPKLQPVALTRPAAPTPVASKTGVAVVQVAAVSHKQDAELLLQALKKRGYNASIRQVPQDKLLHIQLGPYATKQDATTMRDRLVADGYNAIIK